MLLLGSEVKVTSYLTLWVLYSSLQSPAMGHGPWAGNAAKGVTRLRRVRRLDLDLIIYSDTRAGATIGC